LADLDAALLATAQVFSKGKVSAEELRGQIGERLPGAFTLFAESIGKTPAELDKMLEKGQVSLNDFMSFVRLLSSDYGQQALAMAASSEAAGDRLATAFGRMQENVGKAIQPIGAQFQEMFAKFVEGASPVLETALPAIGELALSVAKNIDVIAASIAALAAGALVNAIATTGGLAAAFNSLTTAVMASNAALLLNPWVALAAGITVATVALVKHHNAQREFNDLISSGAGTTGQLKEAQQALEQRLARTKAQLKNVGGGMRDSAGDTKILQDRVKELQMQLDKLKGTYTVRVRLETQGYGGFGDDGMPKTYTVAGVTYDIASGRPITAPKSDVKFPTAPPETAADKTKKGPKPPEDRTLQYQQELVYLKNINEQELGREVLIRQGRDLEAARADMTRRQVEIEYERERALAAANYQGERDVIRAIAAEKLRRSELQYMLDRQKIEKDTFDKRIEANKSIQDAAKPIRDALDARMRELNNTKEYARLIQEGVLPAEAKRLIAYKELVQSAIKQQDEELKLLEIKLEQLKASNLSADIAEGERKRIEEQIDLIKRKKEAIEGAAASGPGPAETDIDRINAGITAAQEKLNELTNVGNIVVTAANNIGNAFGEAFNKLVTGAGSARQVLSQFFQDVANGFFKMAQEIIAQTLIMITLQAILKALGGASTSESTNTPNLSDVQSGANFNLGERITTSTRAAAKGDAFTPQGPVERYAKGGIVNAPTLFRYAKGGTFAPGLMGEAGPEAILPLRRTPDGRLGVTQVRSPQGGDRMREMLGRSPAQQQAPTLNLKFETTTINGVEYVSREQLEVAMAETRKRASKEGAERGMSMTLDKMRNSPRTRAQVGMR
jgi:tape measure domain-containing protein